MSRQLPRSSLRLHALEPREMPAIIASFNATTGTLTVAGDQLNNSIIVSRDIGGAIFVNGGAVLIAGGSPTVANTTRIRILGNRGGDTLRLDPANGALPPAVISGGPGNDDISGGTAADTILAGAGNDLVDGNPGDDIIFLGAGIDTMIWNPGEGSDKIEGELGQDQLTVNGSNGNEIMELGVNGTRLRFTRDVDNVALDVAGVETVDVNDFGGADRIIVNNLAATAVRQTNLNLSADAQNDQVILNGTNGNDSIVVAGNTGLVTVTGLLPAIQLNLAEVGDDLTVHALGGNDKVIATGLAIGVLDLVVDGGSGNDNLFGSQDADIFIGEDGNDFVFGDNGDDVALLGAGNDTFQWDPGDANDTVEGQDGTDRMTFNGNNASESIDIAANGGRVRFFRNVASVTMDLDDVERVDFNAKGGVDATTVNDLTGTDLKEIRVDLAAAPPAIAGDDQPDRVIVTGTNGNDTVNVATIAGQTWVIGLAAKVVISHAESQIDEVTVNGLGGNDTLSSTAMAVSGPLVTLEGGDGDDTITAGAGDDVLLGGNGNDRLIGLAGDDLIDGGAGDDSVTGGLGDDILNGGDGTDTIDGGLGDDVAANGETVINV